jgi:hypothetical protein
MDEAARKPWTDKSAKEKENVEKYKADFASKGHFTLADGSKSSDPKNAGLFKKNSFKEKIA